MYPNVGFKDSNVPGNGYRFTCPVVERDALLIACLFMRKKHMRGERFAAQDCQCAMRGSKCPAMRMLHMEWTQGERQFFDPESRHHRLPRPVLEQIEKVVLMPMHAQGLDLTPEQSKRLFEGKIVVPKAAEKEALPTPATKRAAKPRVEEKNAVDALEGVKEMSAMINSSLTAIDSEVGV